MTSISLTSNPGAYMHKNISDFTLWDIPTNILEISHSGEYTYKQIRGLTMGTYMHKEIRDLTSWNIPAETIHIPKIQGNTTTNTT